MSGEVPAPSAQVPSDPALTDRLRRVADEVAAAADAVGREPGAVQVLLATKTVAPQRIRAALAAGFGLIGENRVQELVAKAPQLADLQPRTHLIGHLQRNKVAAVLPHVECIQSIDSIALAERIDRLLAEHPDGRRRSVMVQVNVSGESSKYGVPPEQAADLVAAVAELDHLDCVGLMTIGLNSPDRSAVRDGYRTLRELRDALLPDGQLSMGMSADFADAIAEGATMVRIGSAAFGSRD